MENKFKVGQKVRIIDGTNAHAFGLGNIVTITHVPDPAARNGYYQARGEDVKYHKGYTTNQYMPEEQMQALIDFELPLYTTEGTPVEYVSHRGRDPKFPVLAYEGKAKQLSKFTADGIHSSGEARRNLTNTETKPEPIKATVYVNFYSDGTTGNFPGSREKADSMAAAVEKSGQRKRIGVTKVLLEEGKFDA